VLSHPHWRAKTRGLALAPLCGVCDVRKGQVCAARSVQSIHAEHGHVSNTASLTTADSQADSPARG
jgi:hypothetical protein